MTAPPIACECPLEGTQINGANASSNDVQNSTQLRNLKESFRRSFLGQWS
jgi:hypothetical protein